jgi:hypothetical protein
MTTEISLKCTFEDAEHNLLLAGIALDMSAKVSFFEEMAELAYYFQAFDRLEDIVPQTTPVFINRAD